MDILFMSLTMKPTHYLLYIFFYFLCARGSSFVIKYVKSGKKRKCQVIVGFLFFLKNSCENDSERIHQ